MKFFLISDNIDTLGGMRLAGIEGVVAHTDKEVDDALDKALSEKTIEIILITEKLVTLCHDKIYNIKLNTPRPLIVEIPDRHGGSQISDTISAYVKEAIGITL